MTFSIAAFDPTTGDLAIGVASRFLAVGAVVPFARAGVGAVATQAYANTRWGPWGEGSGRAGGVRAARVSAAWGAGEGAGGDRRGQQSAALLGVRDGAGFRGGNDRYIDVRVDDHPHPLEELSRLLELWRVTFLTPPRPGPPACGCPPPLSAPPTTEYAPRRRPTA